MAKKKAENSKSAVAKAAKEERANAKAGAAARAAEDAYWEAAGDGAKSKAAAKREQQAAERAEAAAKKAEAKRQAELEDAASAAKMTAKASKGNKSSSNLNGGAPAPRALRGASSSAALAALASGTSTPPPTASEAPSKVTHHQLLQDREAEAREHDRRRDERERRARREVTAVDYEQHLDDHADVSRGNRAMGADDVDARSLEAAVAALSVGGSGGATEGGEAEDRYPERRAKAAFASYQERELARLRADRPGLKLSQYKELVWRSWQKSPENPIYMAGRQ